MFNKFTAMVVGVLGLIASIYVGFYSCFCLGLQGILVTATVVDGKIVVDTFWLLVGCLKMVLAGFIFSWLLQSTIGLTTYYWKLDVKE